MKLLKILQYFTKWTLSNTTFFSPNLFWGIYANSSINPHKFLMENVHMKFCKLPTHNHSTCPTSALAEVMSTICVKSSRNQSHLPAFILSTHVQTSSGAVCLNRANFRAVMTAQRSWKKSDLLSFKTDICKLKPQNSWDTPLKAAASLSVTCPSTPVLPPPLSILKLLILLFEKCQIYSKLQMCLRVL